VYKSMTKVSPEIADQAREDPSLVIGYKKFSDLNRLRSDLYAAAQRETGPRKAALETASEKVSKIQEHAADMVGQGQKYRDAKGEYLKAMRSIFSNYFQDWVNLDDDREQDMLAKVGTLMAREPSGNFDQTARALRTTLKAYGIDVSALDDFFRQGTEEQAKTERTKKEAKEGTQRATELQSKLKIGITESSKAAVERQSGMTADQIKAENERAKNAIKPAEEKAGQQEKEVERNPIIPGYSADELSGKKKEELFKLKLQQMAQANRGLPVTGVVMMVYGLIKMSAFPFLYGVTRSALPLLVKNEGFQDWLIKKAGVAPKTPEANRLRRAISEMGPILQRIGRGQLETTAIGTATRKKDDQPDHNPQ